MEASVKSSKSMLFSYKPEEKDLFIQISLKKKLGFQQQLWATVSIRLINLVKCSTEGCF